MTDRLTQTGHTENILYNIGLMIEEIWVDKRVTLQILDPSWAEGQDKLNQHYPVQNMQFKCWPFSCTDDTLLFCHPCNKSLYIECKTTLVMSLFLMMSALMKILTYFLCQFPSVYFHGQFVAIQHVSSFSSTHIRTHQGQELTDLCLNLLQTDTGEHCSANLYSI